MTHHTWVAALAVAGVMTTWPAHATVPPPLVQRETSSTSCDALRGGHDGGPTQCSLPLESAAHIDLLPAVQLNGSVGADLTDISNASADLNYYFEYIGPAGTDLPIRVATKMVASSFGNGGALDTLQISADPGDLSSPNLNLRLAACSNTASFTVFDCSGDPTSVNSIFYMYVHPNQQANVHVRIDLAALSDGGASADLDPMITLDPSFANASDYTFIESDGVGNSLPSSVPEPSEWALLLLGSALAGLAFRRSRHMPVAG